VLDLVEAVGLAAEQPTFSVPACLGGNVSDRLDREVVEDELQRKGVVSVDQKR
jgi:hypothetical protein